MSEITWRSILKVGDKNLHATAIKLCEDFLAARPQHIGAHIVYSRALHSVGRFDDAHRIVDKTILLLRRAGHTDSLSWQYCVKGHLYRDAGDYPAAIRAYLKAHRSDLSEATFLIFAGLAQFRLGLFSKAVKTLEKATDCSQGAVDEANYNLGVVRIAQGNYEAAKTSFLRALEIDSKYQVARKALADVEKAISLG